MPRELLHSREKEGTLPASYRTIRVEIGDSIAVLTVDRPEVRNALNVESTREIHQAIEELRQDPKAGVLVLTGAGDQAFVSGADIRDLATKRKREGLEAVNSRLFQAVERFEKPTVAAINGYALGGGCELAMACDLRVSSDQAKFGLPELGLGLIPGAGGTQRLPRLVGWGRARELILTGDIIDAKRAAEIGLVNLVVPHGELLEKTRELCRKILSRGPFAVRLAKLALWMSAQVPQEAGLLFEQVAQALAYESSDKAEGTRAFLEKRPPKFTGE